MDTPISQPQGKKPTFTDVRTLRENARRNVEEGAVTEQYGADRAKVLDLLNEALATELVCTLRYRHDYFMARGIDSQAAADEFLEHARQELEHADRIAERIVQLGGEPSMDPSQLVARSHSEYRTGRTVQEAIRENLVAERIAIDSYREIVQYLGNNDPTTRRMLEEILAVEEEHADDLAELLGSSSTPVRS
jgi:bacterioferritin